MPTDLLQRLSQLNALRQTHYGALQRRVILYRHIAAKALAELAAIKNAAPETRQYSHHIKVGDRVKIKPGRQHGHSSGAMGTVQGMSRSLALAVKFDGWPGVYKWYVDEELELMAEEEKRRYAERSLTPAERRVDFAAIKKIYDEDALKLGLELRRQLKSLRDEALQLFEQQERAGLSADFAANLKLTTSRDFSKAVEEYLMDVWRQNRDMAIRELPEELQGKLRGLKQYATAFRPDVAGNYFRNRALMIKGIIEDELTKLVKFQIFEHLKGGRILNETMGLLRALFEPWIGDPTKIEPSGISQTPEDILKAARLENIIRTETSTAISQGRAAVADAAEDFVLGYELSAILDERTTDVCSLADGIKVRKEDRHAIVLEPPLHFQCRTILTFITTNDEPVEWSSEAELDRVVREISPEFK
jgi:SPP1 gp7 family putative phage head morphogenesis protein